MSGQTQRKDILKIKLPLKIVIQRNTVLCSVSPIILFVMITILVVYSKKRKETRIIKTFSKQMKDIKTEKAHKQDWNGILVAKLK